jgi:hypothetical protein
VDGIRRGVPAGDILRMQLATHTHLAHHLQCMYCQF